MNEHSGWRYDAGLFKMGSIYGIRVKCPICKKVTRGINLSEKHISKHLPPCPAEGFNQ